MSIMQYNKREDKARRSYALPELQQTMQSIQPLGTIAKNPVSPYQAVFSLRRGSLVR